MRVYIIILTILYYCKLKYIILYFLYIIIDYIFTSRLGSVHSGSRKSIAEVVKNTESVGTRVATAVAASSRRERSQYRSLAASRCCRIIGPYSGMPATYGAMTR